MKIFFIALACMLATSSYQQDTLPVYPGAIPGGLPAADDEETILGADGSMRISRVSRPTLTVFKPEKPNGTAVIICPGGGYVRLSIEKEGFAVARLLAQWGVTAFVLKYRLPSDSLMAHKTTGPLQDAQTAMQLVRLSAPKWGIDTAAIGIMGFSAGGHLAATAGTMYHQPVNSLIAAQQIRPAFMVLIYPVISMSDSLAHKGSRNSLLGSTPTKEMIEQFSAHMQVNPYTPPTFLVHAKNDASVRVENSLEMYQALRNHVVPAELHLFEKGGHGFGLINPTSNERWTDWLHTWMQKHGWAR